MQSTSSPYSPSFLAAIEDLLMWEGGYVNDPADPGGETNFGLSKRSYPSLDVKDLTRAQATAIYHGDWWVRYGLEDLPAPIAKKVLNTNVNVGPYQGAKQLQMSLQHKGQPVTVDGSLGPLTRAACSAVPPDELLMELRKQAKGYYLALIADHPALVRYRTGWLKRAAA